MASHSSPADIHKSIRSYMIVFGSLMALTVVTVMASWLQVGVGTAITIALIIATVKASLVAAVFMHLSHEKTWIYGSLLLTVAFFVVLMLVPILTVADSPGSHEAPWELPAAAAPEHTGH
jgi:cytochrome c oxidase subunit IV